MLGNKQIKLPSYDSSDVIEEFNVEFQVNYWAPDTAIPSDGDATAGTE